MISGLGLFEVLLVLLMILMFFGSKELPMFIREGAKMISKIRKYSESIKNEINDVTQQVIDNESNTESVSIRKDELRKTIFKRVSNLTPDDKKQKSHKIADKIIESDKYKNAQSVMLYASSKTEVDTKELINRILADSKRVILPYCLDNSVNIGIAEIKNSNKDLVTGKFNIQEPISEIRDNFFKSDIQLVICPAVAFDRYGGRLGHGKGYYDRFLKEIKGKTTIIGLGYECQILEDNLPFDYHDINMDMIITENEIITLG